MCLPNFMEFRHCLFKILKNQNVADGQTNGRMEGQLENRIPPTNTVCEGYEKIIVFLEANFPFQHRIMYVL